MSSTAKAEVSQRRNKTRKPVVTVDVGLHYAIAKKLADADVKEYSTITDKRSPFLGQPSKSGAVGSLNGLQFPKGGVLHNYFRSKKGWLTTLKATAAKKYKVAQTITLNCRYANHYEDVLNAAGIRCTAVVTTAKLQDHS